MTFLLSFRRCFAIGCVLVAGIRCRSSCFFAGAVVRRRRQGRLFRRRRRGRRLFGCLLFLGSGPAGGVGGTATGYHQASPGSRSRFGSRRLLLLLLLLLSALVLFSLALLRVRSFLGIGRCRFLFFGGLFLRLFDASSGSARFVFSAGRAFHGCLLPFLLRILLGSSSSSHGFLASRGLLDRGGLGYGFLGKNGLFGGIGGGLLRGRSGQRSRGRNSGIFRGFGKRNGVFLRQQKAKDVVDDGKVSADLGQEKSLDELLSAVVGTGGGRAAASRKNDRGRHDHQNPVVLRRLGIDGTVLELEEHFFARSALAAPAVVAVVGAGQETGLGGFRSLPVAEVGGVVGGGGIEFLEEFRLGRQCFVVLLDEHDRYLEDIGGIQRRIVGGSRRRRLGVVVVAAHGVCVCV
mmetsp:Transcript_102360/g.208332  ORF Transcript_102360/g.208332 Transcript_102360/m.208332 type:complete len:405 (+) Transcript_102360:205-1419(+)